MDMSISISEQCSERMEGIQNVALRIIERAADWVQQNSAKSAAKRETATLPAEGDYILINLTELQVYHQYGNQTCVAARDTIKRKHV
jgi:hypothetical protein